MHQFSYQNPTRIEFGIDKEKAIGQYMMWFCLLVAVGALLVMYKCLFLLKKRQIKT